MRKSKLKSKSGRSALHWRRMLVPIDFSRNSLRALDVAVPLARDHGAQLILLSVIEPSAYAAGLEGVLLLAPGTTLAGEARRRIHALAEKRVPPEVPVSCLVANGKPFDVITRMAKEQRIDLIVLTSHGHSRLDHFMLGSTAERVVRHAPCPVFVVRTRGKE